MNCPLHSVIPNKNTKLFHVGNTRSSFRGLIVTTCHFYRENWHNALVCFCHWTSKHVRKRVQMLLFGPNWNLEREFYNFLYELRWYLYVVGTRGSRVVFLYLVYVCRVFFIRILLFVYVFSRCTVGALPSVCIAPVFGRACRCVARVGREAFSSRRPDVEKKKARGASSKRPHLLASLSSFTRLFPIFRHGTDDFYVLWSVVWTRWALVWQWPTGRNPCV